MIKPTIVQYLIGNEELLAQLYKMYSQKYSSHADFWGRLSDDEKAHAQKIKTITEENSTDIDKSRFNEKGLESFKNAAESEIERFTNKDLDIKQALASASKLEKTLANSKFFESTDKDSDELKSRLQDISESVDKHKERIEKMINRI